jgi:hypothetical protein
MACSMPNRFCIGIEKEKNSFFSNKQVTANGFMEQAYPDNFLPLQYLKTILQ